MITIRYKNGDGEHFSTSFFEGKMSTECYFFGAASSVTSPKFVTLLEYGATPHAVRHTAHARGCSNYFLIIIQYY